MCGVRTIIWLTVSRHVRPAVARNARRVVFVQRAAWGAVVRTIATGRICRVTGTVRQRPVRVDRVGALDSGARDGWTDVVRRCGRFGAGVAPIERQRGVRHLEASASHGGVRY